MRITREELEFHQISYDNKLLTKFFTSQYCSSPFYYSEYQYNRKVSYCKMKTHFFSLSTFCKVINSKHKDDVVRILARYFSQNQNDGQLEGVNCLMSLSCFELQVQ